MSFEIEKKKLTESCTMYIIVLYMCIYFRIIVKVNTF